MSQHAEHLHRAVGKITDAERALPVGSGSATAGAALVAARAMVKNVIADLVDEAAGKKPVVHDAETLAGYLAAGYSEREARALIAENEAPKIVRDREGEVEEREIT